MPTTLLRNILEKAVSSDASDVHIKENSPVAFRINGDMVVSDYTPDSEIILRFLEQVATEEQVEAFNKTGDLDVSHLEDNVGRFRVNIHRQRGLNCINCRWVKNTFMTIDQLGLPEVIQRIAESPRGIIILTGTTGSGKSTFAKLLGTKAICSADDYVTRNGVYNWKPETIGASHDWCQRKCRRFMKKQVERIVVANTSTTERELKPYMDLARQFGYMVYSVIVENRASTKSVHDVPEETIIKNNAAIIDLIFCFSFTKKFDSS